MAGYTLITVRGVLAEYTDNESPAAARLVQEGYTLFNAYKQVSKIMLVIDDAEHVDRLTYWLKIHGLRDFTQILVNPRSDSPAEGRRELLETARRMGAVDLVVEADSSLAARMLHLGATTLLLSVPTYTRPEFKPGASRVGRPWADLVDELEAQNALREADDRVTADVAGTRYEDDS